MLCSFRSVSVGVVHQSQLPEAAAGRYIVKQADFSGAAFRVRHSLRFLHFNIGSTPAAHAFVSRAMDHQGGSLKTY